MSTHATFRTQILAVVGTLALLMLGLLLSGRGSIDTASAAPVAVDTIQKGLALEMFMRIDTVDGESADDKHKSEILIDSYSWGAKRTPSATAPSMQDLTITMPVNKASAKLMVYTAGSVNIPKLVLAVRRKGATQDFLKWTLTDVFISSFTTVGNLHGDGIQDQVGFTFGKVEMEYRQVLPNGTLGEAVKFGWDRRSNKPVSEK